jgi:hypothetical protein
MSLIAPSSASPVRGQRTAAKQSDGELAVVLSDGDNINIEIRHVLSPSIFRATKNGESPHWKDWLSQAVLRHNV